MKANNNRKIFHNVKSDGGSLAIVGNLLMGDVDVIQVFESLRSFSQGKTKVGMKRQT